MTSALAPPGRAERRAARRAGRTGRSQVRLDIEGLRALAVGLVVLYHAGATVVPGGFVGVDVFFVVSGYLITALLLRESADGGRVSLPRFYARRARRLLPAATLVLLATAAAGWWLLPGSQHRNLAADVAGSATWSVNWVLADRSVDYLAEGDLPSPLQHYWSLAIEEQYYLLWPLLIIGVTLGVRRLGAHRGRELAALELGVLGAVAAGLAAASLAWSVLLTADDPARSYFVSTTRFWELAVGSVLAVVGARGVRLPRPAATALAAAGLLAVVAAALVFSSATAWPGAAALLPTLGTAAVIAAGWQTVGAPATAPARLLSLRPLVWLGGLSYAVYLWHWPLLVLSDVRAPDLGLPARLLVGGVLAVALAWVTKHLVEDPVRFHPRLGRPRRALALGAGLVACSLAAAAAVWASVPDLDDAPRTAGAQALVADPTAERWTLVPDPTRLYDDDGPVSPPPALAPDDAPLRGGCQVPLGNPDLRTDCQFGDPASSQVVALVGDSKAGQWFPALRSITKREGWRLDVHVKSACALSVTGVVEDCAAHTAALLEHFREAGAPDVVLLSQMSSSYDASTGGFERAVDELRALGTRIVFLADSPTSPDLASYDCVDRADSYRSCGFERTAERLAGAGTPLLEAVAADRDLPLIDLNRWICPPGLAVCPPVVADTLVYRQGSHVTATYVKTLTPMLHRALVEAGVADTPLHKIRLTRR
ncbi:acyltransferase family protein [Nocardioides sp. SYSU DS0663]|uniref:acyltransferase family protein n=1 Tax=Nocardioides sp. SYSU DS0663 TaxID=3416445 RepID=UPI003F4BE07E